jgi:hypothetical protein
MDYDDAAKMNVSSHILIRDYNTKQVLLSKNVTRPPKSDSKTEMMRHD